MYVSMYAYLLLSHIEYLNGARRRRGHKNCFDRFDRMRCKIKGITVGRRQHDHANMLMGCWFFFWYVHVYEGVF